MPAAVADTKTRITTALNQTRHARHHPDCRCGLYKRHWCTEAEWSWQQMLDRLIETALRESF